MPLGNSLSNTIWHLEQVLRESSKDMTILGIRGESGIAWCSGPFWLKWVGLPPVILGLSILSKKVETGPTATQFDSVCAQTMPRLPGACLWRVELFQMSCGRQI